MPDFVFFVIVSITVLCIALIGSAGQGVALLAEEMANQKRYVVDYKDNPTARQARNEFIYGRLDADTATMFEAMLL